MNHTTTQTPPPPHAPAATLQQPTLPRHFSDSTAFTPRHPSRLRPQHLHPPLANRHAGVSGKGTASDMTLDATQSRGTVSMPTTPTAAVAAGNVGPGHVWSQTPPHTAQHFYDIPADNPDQGFNPTPHIPSSTPAGWYDVNQLAADATSSSLSDGFQMSTDEFSAAEDGNAPPPRKKRAQVRIACTHCQKACKKCSNTRPCERCVKYGLKDCVDSMRKPRRTGVKRGPYKRRSSSRYNEYDSAGSGNESYPPHNLPQPPPHHPPPFPLGESHYRPPSPLQQPQQQYPHSQHSHPHEQQSHFPPPGPRTAALQVAFASALHGPRWNHGFRPDAPAQQQVMYPPTPNAPFPISLAGREDPFSRAVSPIHGAFDQAMNGLKPPYHAPPHPAHVPTLAGGPRDSVFDAMIHQGMVNGGMDTHMTDTSPGLHSSHSGHSNTTPFDAFSDPFSPTAVSQFTPHHQSLSAPTSPRQKTTGLPWNGRPGMQRASSTEPVVPSSHRLYNLQQHLDTMSVNANPNGLHALQSPAVVALKKIRKPSLRTLMSHGGSQAGSRPVSPIQESPTLFDQPMSLDDEEGLSQLGSLPPQAWFGGLQTGFEMGGGTADQNGMNGETRDQTSALGLGLTDINFDPGR